MNREGDLCEREVEKCRPISQLEKSRWRSGGASLLPLLPLTERRGHKAKKKQKKRGSAIQNVRLAGRIIPTDGKNPQDRRMAGGGK